MSAGLLCNGTHNFVVCKYVCINSVTIAYLCCSSCLLSKEQLHQNASEESTDWMARMGQLLISMPGLGTRCMNPSVHSIE